MDEGGPRVHTGRRSRLGWAGAGRGIVFSCVSACSCRRGGCNVLSVYDLSERLRMLLFAVYRTLRPVCCVRAPGTRRGTMSMRDFVFFLYVSSILVI